MLALALAAGIAFADSALAPADAALWLGATLALLAALGPLRSAPLAAGALGVAFAAGWLAHAAELELADRHAIVQATDATIEARVCELDVRIAWVSVLLCELRSPTGRALPRRVRVRESCVRHDCEALAALAAGDRIRARVRLRPLREPGNPGQRSRARVERRRGIGAHASLLSPQLLVGLSGADAGASRALPGRVAQLRRQIGERLAGAGPGGALLRALAIGDRGAISPAARDQWAQLGISHLLAVSGLHLALVAGLAYSLLRLALAWITPLAMRGDVRTQALLGACLCAAGFAVLAGWGIPVRRALVFLCAAAAARLLGRSSNPAHALAAAALVVLASHPAALFEPGAQLSFVASAALLFSLAPAASAPGASRSAFARLATSVSLLVRTSATVTALTAPLLALHEMRVSSVALLANAIAVPATALLLLPLALLAALAASSEPTAVSDAVIVVAERAAALALWAASAAAAWVGESSPRPAPPLGFAAIALALGIASLRCVGTLRRVVIALVVIAILRAAPAVVLAPQPPRVVSLDVGAGDATLVQGRSGALLVDAGLAIPGGLDLGRSVVLPALRALGIRRLDLLVASHADADHRGGLPAVMAALPVAELWIPPGGLADPDFAELLASAHERGTRVLERGRGDAAAHFGDLRVTPLWPPRGAPSLSRNDASLVLRVEVAERRVLLTGDIGMRVEARLLEAGEDLRADLIKIAHHGSRASSSRPFLEAVAADLALVSAACSVRSALPSRAALSRLHATGAAAWWTGRHGAVFVALPSQSRPLSAWSWLSKSRASCDWPQPRAD